MPEIQKSRNTQIYNALGCAECIKIGSTDCIDHGGRLREDTTVLGKRLGFDVFGDFRGSFELGPWDKGLGKSQTKRPNAGSSNPIDRDSFLELPTPKLVVTPCRPAPSNVASPSPALKLVPQSRPESSGFANPPLAIKPTAAVPTLIKPTASVPTLIKPTPSVPVSAPAVAPSNTEAIVLPNDPSTPSDLTREHAEPENDENGCKEGGVRFRVNLGKYVVEYRPPRFKWKLWMGTYATVEEGRRACDCARFYAGQDKGGFYFKDSPTLFGDLGPLNRPFSLVSKDVKDKAFNVELKKRAKLVIKKVLDAQRPKQSVDITRPTVKTPLPEATAWGQIAGARTNGRSDRVSSPSQESVANSPVIDSGLEENEFPESTKQEVASAAVEAGNPLTSLDAFEDLPPLDYPPSAFSVIHSEDHDFQGCTLDYEDSADEFDYDIMNLWNHDEC